MDQVSGAGANGASSERLAGTVKLYRRHVFVCTGQKAWPAHIDEDGGFCQALAEAIAAAGPAVVQPVKLNACDESSRDGGYDLLVFPEMVRYIGLEPGNLPAFVEDQLVMGEISARLTHEPIGGRHLFVCVHEARDPRCGECGPAVADRLAEELAARGLGADIHLHRSSHVGGHQHAGNLLIYPEGDWYGRVTPAEVPAIVEKCLLAGETLPTLWRGRMGMSPIEQLQAVGEA